MEKNRAIYLAALFLLFSTGSLAQTSSEHGKAFNSAQGTRPAKTASIPNWPSWMKSEMEDQGTCNSCWAHAATSTVEAVLHYTKSYNLNIDLNEDDIANVCDGSTDQNHPVSVALNFIKTYGMTSEVGSFPNLQGVKWSILQYRYSVWS